VISETPTILTIKMSDGLALLEIRYALMYRVVGVKHNLVVVQLSIREGTTMADAWDERKKGQEEEYFHRKNKEALEKTRQRAAVEERERQKQASYMRCPKCGEKLEEITFQEIQVDRCPGCGGVWLDPGELERLNTKESQGWLASLWRSRADK
jgi:Zn-finger nucleic acid-binding protein